MLGQSFLFLDINRDWNSRALACRWAHSVQNSSSSVAITPVGHRPLPPCFVSSCSYKMEAPAPIPQCIPRPCLHLTQLSGSISWTPTKTCSRRKSSSLTGEALILTCGLKTPVHFHLEGKSLGSTKESSFLRVSFAQLILFCCKEQYKDLREQPELFSLWN